MGGDPYPGSEQGGYPGARLSAQRKRRIEARKGFEG